MSQTQNQKIILNNKIIQDMCGPTSFKRGETFHRTGKITMEQINEQQYVATVLATSKQSFIVNLNITEDGHVQPTCSCPKLSSFQKDCQHIAGALIFLLNYIKTNNQQDIFSIFNEKPKRTLGKQRHFETREIITPEIILTTIGQSFGLQLVIANTNIPNAFEFLRKIADGNSSRVSPSFTFDQTKHCFPPETNEIIQQLLDGSLHEKNNTIIVTPATFKVLFPLLKKMHALPFTHNRKSYPHVHMSAEPLDLRFTFLEGASKTYELKIDGLENLTLMEKYEVVIDQNKLKPLEQEDMKRLAELKRLTNKNSNVITIPPNQIGLFLEKVVPGLKKFGEIKLPESVKNNLNQTPLVAKLYLDRLKNKLLVGLEFHYDNIIINPVEDKAPNIPFFLRNVEKEEQILELLEESQLTQTESGYFLQNEDLEYEFLYHVVPKLQHLTQIYATTTVRNRVSRENVKPKIRVKIQKERTNWLEFKFELDGIKDIHIRDLMQALEEKRKYYRLKNGTLLSLEAKEYEEIQRFLQAVPEQMEDLESGLNMPIVKGLKLLETIENDDTLTLEDSFKSVLEKLQNPENGGFIVPATLEPILRDYQKQGYQWLKTLASYSFGGILADDMGLGKTLQSITYIASELDEIRRRKQPILIVCPSSLTYNWLQEIQKFAPEISAGLIDGSKQQRTVGITKCTDFDCVITSYPLLRMDIKQWEQIEFHTIFFDEAQNFKNPITQTARAVKQLKAEHRFALTGTPIENSIEELWSIFHVVFPELFQGLREFSFLPNKTISRRVRPFLLRRLKEDVLGELPGKIEQVDSAELLPEQKKLYAAYLAKLREDTLKHLDKDTFRKNRIKILAGLTRLRQICCHPKLFVQEYNGSSAKMEQLLQIIEESKQAGRRVLIFSQFTKMLDLIGKELAYQGMPYFYLDGKTPSEERVERCHRFNEGERDFFLISLKAGGTGLNLTGADTVILYDIWWNPAVEEQAADRAHRMGQTEVVQVIKLIARGTIEEKMNELQEKKRNVIQQILDPDERTSTSLTEEDIREILMIDGQN
ncbi:DEAD/DEAH box helicase [Bacillus sp. FJAT-45066]|uniref:DEAD/DEAH box helicase n=1 Tax=Bacillus sp. FJAT-45066 TaxID=2011010 RepID=UPI000BB91F07|nr:DEAD/DEAH box helicase [Bacillus sp. FJAT-45066]